MRNKKFLKKNISAILVAAMLVAILFYNANICHCTKHFHSHESKTCVVCQLVDMSKTNSFVCSVAVIVTVFIKIFLNNSILIKSQKEQSKTLVTLRVRLDD